MKKLYFKSLALLVLLMTSVQSYAVYEHFSLLGNFWEHAEWEASSTTYPINRAFNHNVNNQYYRVLKLNAGNYSFALTNSLNNSSSSYRYAPATDATNMALNVGGAFGTYENVSNNAWTVSIPEDGYYRVVVDETAGGNGEWYPAVRFETNNLKIQQSWANWADADMTRDGDVYTATFSNMTAGDKEFVIRGSGMIQYYYNTTGVSTSNSEITLSQTSADFPNFKFHLNEPGNVTITLTYNPSNPMEVEVSVAATQAEPIEGDGSKFYGYFEDGNATYSFGLAYCFTWEGNGQVSCVTCLTDKATRPDGFVYELWNYTTGATFNGFAKQEDNTYTAAVTEGPYYKDANLNLGFRVVYAGGGDVYPNSHIHYTVGSTSAPYTLTDQLVGEWYTICLPFDATIEGATLYSIGSASTEAITVSEAGNAAEAGKAYLYKPTATTVTATYTAVAAHTADTYLTGNLSATPVELTEADDAYILDEDNKFHHIEGTATATINQYKAYLKLPAAAAPARALRIVEGPAVATDLESVDANSAVKFFENGQLFIKKNGVVYTVMGQIVK